MIIFPSMIRQQNCYPRVLVLMATFNGINWINQQIESILNQKYVNITVYISDDGSTDGSIDLIDELIKKYSNITVLKSKITGSAGQNFYSMIINVNEKNFDYIAFADQDDVWNQDKLCGQIALMKKHSAEAVSSDVIAFFDNHKEILITKSQPQRRWDFLFESAGPGCTYLISPWLLGKIREQLLNNKSPAKEVVHHDWLAYAVCRSYGAKWLIDSKPTLRYRQHGSNVVGANIGLKAKRNRLVKVYQGWYRGEVCKICQVSAIISKDFSVEYIGYLVSCKSLASNIALLRIMGMTRRRLLDRWLLAFSVAVFIF